MLKDLHTLSPYLDFIHACSADPDYRDPMLLTEQQLHRNLLDAPENPNTRVLGTFENDTVTGFNLGGDDYISKPFSLREVVARVKAVLRRTAETQAAQPDILTYHGLSMDIAQKRVTINGEDVALTKKEFEILKLLLKSPGKVFSREDILAKIWSDEVYVLDRTVDVNITRLRKKIGDYGKHIITRLGYGYCFDEK